MHHHVSVRTGGMAVVARLPPVAQAGSRLRGGPGAAGGGKTVECRAAACSLRRAAAGGEAQASLEVQRAGVPPLASGPYQLLVWHRRRAGGTAGLGELVDACVPPPARPGQALAGAASLTGFFAHLQRCRRTAPAARAIHAGNAIPCPRPHHWCAIPGLRGPRAWLCRCVALFGRAAAERPCFAATPP